MDIKVEQLTEVERELRGIDGWPIWECDVSRFDWYYGQTEECLLLEGEVIVETVQGETFIQTGDYVTFPQGLRCVWDVKKPVKKHYRFS